MSTPERKLPGWVLPAVSGALVIALVAIALLRGPVALDPDSPEGAVQEYLVAINEQRWDDALEVMHEDWRGDCVGEDLESFAADDFTAQLGTAGRAAIEGGVVRETFVGVSEDGDTSATVPDDATEVEVTINFDSGGGLSAGWSEWAVFELVDDGEFWWLVGDPWPYFTWNCRGTG